MEEGIEKLERQCHIRKKANNNDKNCFVSPAVITVKKDESLKIALDSLLTKQTQSETNAQSPNMEELISKLSRKVADGPADAKWSSNNDLAYIYGQLIVSREARNLCIFPINGEIVPGTIVS